MRIYLCSCLLCRIVISFTREHLVRFDPVTSFILKFVTKWVENPNPGVTFFFNVFPKSLPKLLIASAVTLELGASLGWNLSHTMLQQQAYCFLSTVWLAHALLCTICQGPLSLQAQHKVKVSQHIVVGTLLCWKQTSLPSVSATWYWLRHHKEEKKLNASCIFCNAMYCDYCGGCMRTLVENEAPF